MKSQIPSMYDEILPFCYKKLKFYYYSILGTCLSASNLSSIINGLSEKSQIFYQLPRILEIQEKHLILQFSNFLQFKELYPGVMLWNSKNKVFFLDFCEFLKI